MLRRAMMTRTSRPSAPTPLGIFLGKLAAALVVLSLAQTAAAQQQPPPAPKVQEGEEFEPESVRSGPPPSKMLERAKKLYDRGDYYSATIELDKVMKGTEDSEANKQRAEFFMGKALFHL